MTTSEPKPLVSIVLPCRNEQGFIQNCLQSILEQAPCDGGIEVIVADGMSTDGTRAFLQQMADSHPAIRVLDNPGRIVSTGLNAAIKAARGEIIVRMDAHSVYAPDYVRQCVAVLNETGADNVGGPMQTVATTFMERAIRAVFHSSLAMGGAQSHLVGYEGCVESVIYGCWRKSIFDRIGYFDEELVRNQDDELNLRIVRAGGTIHQSKRIRSWYQVRGSLKGLFRQYMQFGYWKVLVIRKHRMPASWRHVVPGIFVGALGLVTMLGLLWFPALWAAAVLAGIYALGTLAIALPLAARSEWKLLPVLPVVIATFHFGYGYGFLRGILDFMVSNSAPKAKFVQLTREGLKRPGSVQD